MRSFVVYRDALFAPSESFIPRMYCGFTELHPIYLGAKFAADRATSPEAHLVADHARTGWLGQAVYRQLGRIPGPLRQWLAHVAPVLIHGQFGRGGALAMPIADALGLPLAVTFHGGDATKDKHFRGRGLSGTIFQRRRAQLMRRADLILCVSDFIRHRLIERGFPPAKLRTHHLGVQVPERLDQWPDPGARRLLFVGRFVEKKGLHDLIVAAARLGELGEDVQLVLVGDGELRARIEAAAAGSGIRHRLTGWLPPEAVVREMADAAVLLVPSRSAASGDAEGVPTVIFEAQARGLPVVATRHGGIPEAIRDRETGLLVDAGQPEAIAAAVRGLLADQVLYRKLQHGGRRSVETCFDATRQSSRLERILLEVVSEHRARSRSEHPCGRNLDRQDKHRMRSDRAP
jgi:colanic acid/amylovoran biosynthesis glycosyltransferase